MDKLERVIQAFENCTDPEMNDDNETVVDCIRAGVCPWDDCQERDSKLIDIPLSLAIAALELLKDQEPRVMTLEEVIEHYSLPPVFPDDLGMQFDYYEDIEPLYFDFPHPEDPWIVHWRGYNQVGKYLEDWKAAYGKSWRCWNSRPTEEQRKAVKWDAAGHADPAAGCVGL